MFLLLTSIPLSFEVVQETAVIHPDYYAHFIIIFNDLQQAFLF